MSSLSAEDLAAARSLIAVARSPGGAREALEGVYREAAEEIRSRGPTCWTSGKCCNFEAYGHRLYVTGLEAACTLARHAERSALSLQQLGDAPVLTPQTLGAARQRGGCPFQVGTRCGVHLIKPLACRVYFCDQTAQAWQHEAAERLHASVRAVHDAHGVAYIYAEWRAMLELMLEAGA